jgi:Pentapeptide repeats (8 copies)
MRDNSQCNFAGQDLRNRSFAGQYLRGADFSHADLRGCNFRKACLTGANFSHARLGRSPFQSLLRASVTIGVALIMADAVSRLVFAALGKTWEDPAWPFVLLLQGVMAAIGLVSAISLFAKSPLRSWAYWAAGLLTGAVLGFFYGGYLNKSNPGTATVGAIIGLVLMGVLLRVAGAQPWLKVGVAVGRAIALYGFTFFVGMWATAAWSTSNLLLALGLSGLGLSALWLSSYQLLKLLTDIQKLPGTFFQGADLENTTFDIQLTSETKFLSQKEI